MEKSVKFEWDSSTLSFQIMPRGRCRGCKWHATQGSTRQP